MWIELASSERRFEVDLNSGLPNGPQFRFIPGSSLIRLRSIGDPSSAAFGAQIEIHVVVGDNTVAQARFSARNGTTQLLSASRGIRSLQLQQCELFLRYVPPLVMGRAPVHFVFMASSRAR